VFNILCEFAARDFYSRLTSQLHSNARCCLKHLYQVGLRAVGTPWDRPALTPAVGGRGAISERWVVAAHLPRVRDSRPDQQLSKARGDRTLLVATVHGSGGVWRKEIYFEFSSVFIIVVITYWNWVVTRWQLSLHQYRQLSLGDSSPYTSTDSCHSVAAVLTPVQSVVTRWQQSLHQYRQLSLGDSSSYTSTDSCHSVTAVLTPVQTKQIRINIHKRNNTKHSTNNTKHSKYKYTYYQITHTYTHQHIKNQVITTTVQDTLTYSMEQIFLEKLTSLCSLSRNFPHFYGTRRSVQDTHEIKQSQYNQVPSV
jgi:hypothetical protein